MPFNDGQMELISSSVHDHRFSSVNNIEQNYLGPIERKRVRERERKGEGKLYVGKHEMNYEKKHTYYKKSATKSLDG